MVNPPHTACSSVIQLKYAKIPNAAIAAIISLCAASVPSTI